MEEKKSEQRERWYFSESAALRKKVLAGFLVFAFFIVVASVLSIGLSIRGPILKQVADNHVEFSELDFDMDLLLTRQEQQEKENSELQRKDTDKDTLSDFDELYVYSTSPYLVDSDSDGYTDAEEIATGNDPNCATGAVCYGSTQTDVADTTFLQGAEFGEDITNIPAQALRITLIDLGIDPELISRMTDEEIINVYNTQIAPELETQQIEAEDEDIEALSQLSVAEIRAHLIAQGMPEEMVNAFSDQELEQILAETLEEL